MSQRSPEDRRLKIGYVLKKYPRLSETFILDELLGLEDRGVEVAIHSLLPPTDGRFHADLSKVKGEVRYLPSLGSEGVFDAFASLRDLGARAVPNALDRSLAFLDRVSVDHRASLLIQAIHLAAAATKGSFDHLHAHFMTLPGRTAYLAHLFSGIPFSVTAHAKDIYLRTVNRDVFTEIAENATAIVTVCEANRRHIRDEVLRRPARIEVVYNSVSPSVTTKEGTLRDPRVVLSVGRLVEKKGFAVMLDACALLRDRNVDFQCVLIGDGEEAERLRAQRARLKLEDRVQMLGAMPRDEVVRWMRRARVLAAPCLEGTDGNRDALPTVLLEALASGLPAVSTPVGGIPEIIDSGVEGLLTPPGEAAALADALQRLLTEPQLWDRIAEAGPKKAAARFHRSTNLPRLIDLFRGSAGPERVLEAVP